MLVFLVHPGLCQRRAEALSENLPGGGHPLWVLLRKNPQASKRFRLSANRLLNTNVFLGIGDVLARKKIYATMLAVLVIAAFIIIVPQNLHNTISSNGFITYMGVGNSDLRLDIQQTDQIAEKAAEIALALENDGDIAKLCRTDHQNLPGQAGGRIGRADQG